MKVAELYATSCTFEVGSREEFERVLDHWIAGRARIVFHSGGGQTLETKTEAGRRKFLSTNTGPLRGKPSRIVTNAS